MTITDLDFNELRSGEDVRGHGLQNLMAAIGSKHGFNVELGGSGADKGRDLFLSKNHEIAPGLFLPSKILVSCKDRTESGSRLKTSDIAGWSARVAEHGCNGFILATTVVPTDDLVTHVRDTAHNAHFAAKIWQPEDLRRILLEQQDTVFRFTIARFFPKSSQSNDSASQMFDLFLEALKHLEIEKALELSLEYLDDATDPILVWDLIENLTARKDCSVGLNLQPHFVRALRLNNSELELALSEPLTPILTDWVEASDDYDWEDVEIAELSFINEFIEIKFVCSQNRYLMGEQLQEGLNGKFQWSKAGLELVELQSDWEDECE